jgi:hypothetical protein
MKTILLVLMTLASVAMAGVAMAEDRQINMAMAGDRQIKALLVGKWTDNYDQKTIAFWADGKLLWNADVDDPNPYKWDIQNGQLIEIRGGGLSDHSYTILFLTKHEFLALVNRGYGRNYIFLKR